MIEINQDKFLGNYRGQVKSVADPLNKGRIQVQVLPMFAGAADADLPWAIPAMPLFCGAASGQGSLCIPTVGSWVWCFFEAGEFMQPVYFAEAGNGALALPDAANLPNRRAFVSPAGLEISFDDTSKTVTILAPAGGVISVIAPILNVGDGTGVVNVLGTTVNITGSTQVHVQGAALHAAHNWTVP